jgi:hypothetical protein
LREAVAKSYSWADSRRSLDDLDLLETLEAERNPQAGASIARALPSFQVIDAGRTVTMLKRIATWAPDWLLAGHVAEVIGRTDGNGANETYSLEIPAGDLQELIWHFLRLTTIDSYSVDSALKRFARSNPLGLLEFLRSRITQEPSVKLQKPDYDAVPHEMHFTNEGLHESGNYVDVLRELREWVRESGREVSALSMEATFLIKRLSKGAIDEALSEVLSEWMEGTDDERRAVAHILSQYSGQDAFYSLSKELVSRTDDKFVLAHLSGACLSGGGSMPLSALFAERIPVFQAWLDDPNTPLKARLFARKMIQSLTGSVEVHEQIESERDW